MVLVLVDVDQRCQDVEAISLRRAATRTPQLLHFTQSLLVVTLRSDQFQCSHRHPRLRNSIGTGFLGTVPQAPHSTEGARLGYSAIMSPAAAILQEALKLPVSERGQIIHELIDSLDAANDEPTGAVETAWAQELERRASDVHAEAGVDLNTACDELEAKRRGGGR